MTSIETTRSFMGWDWPYACTRSRKSQEENVSWSGAWSFSTEETHVDGHLPWRGPYTTRVRASFHGGTAAVTGRPMIHLSPSEFKRTATADLLGTSAFCIVRPVWSSLDLFLSSSSSSMSSVGRIYRGYLLKSFILFFLTCKLFMSCTNPLY